MRCGSNPGVAHDTAKRIVNPCVHMTGRLVCEDDVYRVPSLVVERAALVAEDRDVGDGGRVGRHAFGHADLATMERYLMKQADYDVSDPGECLYAYAHPNDPQYIKVRICPGARWVRWDPTDHELKYTCWVLHDKLWTHHCHR